MLTSLLSWWAVRPLEVADPGAPGHHGERRRQHAENFEGLAAVLLVHPAEGSGDEGHERVDDGVDFVLAHLQVVGSIVLHLVRGTGEV